MTVMLKHELYDSNNEATVATCVQRKVPTTLDYQLPVVLSPVSTTRVDGPS